MMGGGIADSTAAIIAGSSGSGKSLTALSFLIGGAAQEKPGLLVTFEERPSQLILNAEQLGWDLAGLMQRGMLDILHVSPSELDIDKHAFVIQQRAAKIKARTVVIDTISAINAGLKEGLKSHDYLWAISDYFKRTGVSIIMTYETLGNSDSVLVGEPMLSFLADCTVHLRLEEHNGYIRRTISVPKMRGTAHDKAIREMIIDSDGLRVGDVYSVGRNHGA
jgi:circadian clock protein KaiC